MQRERSRERLERARRQWELENADTLNTSNTSLPRHANIPSYEATVLHMVTGYSLDCWNLIQYLKNPLNIRTEPQAPKPLLEFL